MLIVFLLLTLKAKADSTDFKAMSDLLSENKILGGRKASPGEFPWAASFRFDYSGNYCGGSVVTRAVVVTACHCAVKIHPLTDKMEHFSIRNKLIHAGTISTDIRNGQLRKIVSMTVHPRCARDPIKGQGYVNDFAYATVDRAFTFNKELQPVPLYKAELNEGKKYFQTLILHKFLCQTSGFGYTSHIGDKVYSDPSLELKGIDLNIIDDKTCRKFLCKDHEAYCNISLEEKNNICAVSPTGGDACKGDSGASLVCEGKAVGILSWGPRCGEGPSVVPSMYALVNRAQSFFPFEAELDHLQERMSRKIWTTTAHAKAGCNSRLEASFFILILLFF